MEDITKVAPVDNNSNEPADLQEEWRDITDPRVAPGRYQVSNLGRIRNVETGRVLKPFIARVHHYVCIALVGLGGTYPGFYVHRLVAQYFLPVPAQDQTQVDHIDGNRWNNTAINLRWVSPKENIHNPVTRERYLEANKKRIEKQFVPVQCIETEELFNSIKEAADSCGLAPCTITSSCKSFEADRQTQTSRRRVKDAKHFRYVQVDLPTIDLTIAATASTSATNRRPVRCIEDGVTYPSIHAAARAYKIAPSTIYASLAHKDNGSFFNKHKGLRTVRHFELVDN